MDKESGKEGKGELRGDEGGDVDVAWTGKVENVWSEGWRVKGMGKTKEKRRETRGIGENKREKWKRKKKGAISRSRLERRDIRHRREEEGKGRY